MKKENYIQLWLRKADGDLKVARRELQAEDSVLEAVCFHLQQAVEKYIKAFLSKYSDKIKRTHNLEFLIEQCVHIDEEFKKYEEKFDQIAGCGVEVRYPDTFIVLDEEVLNSVREIVEHFREFVIGKIETNGKGPTSQDLG